MEKNKLYGNARIQIIDKDDVIIKDKNKKVTIEFEQKKIFADDTIKNIRDILNNY